MKVLIIEDDVQLAKTISLTFNQLKIQHDHSVSALDALEMLGVYEYDLLLLDVLLPDMNGLELLKKIRSNNMNTPVLILSGLNDYEHKIEGLNIGADDYLTKPFNKNELVARINALVRRSNGLSKDLIRVGDLEIDLGTKQVNVSNTTVSLTNKEYSILEILARRQGKPVSKEQLLDRLYGGIDEPEPKIIDVFICKLRKKLQRVSNINYIGTMWGQGYIIQTGEKHLP